MNISENFKHLIRDRISDCLAHDYDYDVNALNGMKNLFKPEIIEFIGNELKRFDDNERGSVDFEYIQDDFDSCADLLNYGLDRSEGQTGCLVAMFYETRYEQNCVNCEELEDKCNIEGGRPCDFNDPAIKEWVEELYGKCEFRHVCMYEHGAVSFSQTSFEAPQKVDLWDSGIVGTAFIPHKWLEENGLDPKNFDFDKEFNNFFNDYTNYVNGYDLYAYSNHSIPLEDFIKFPTSESLLLENSSCEDTCGCVYVPSHEIFKDLSPNKMLLKQGEGIIVVPENLSQNYIKLDMLREKYASIDKHLDYFLEHDMKVTNVTDEMVDGLHEEIKR